MDPLLTNDERNMREGMLQHEFPFDEKAWISMEALLERDKEKLPAGLPPKPVEPLPGPGRNWGLVLILLVSFSLGAASLLWWNSSRGIPESNSSAHDNPSSNESTHAIPSPTANGSESIIQPATDESDEATPVLIPKSSHRDSSKALSGAARSTTPSKIPATSPSASSYRQEATGVTKQQNTPASEAENPPQMVGSNSIQKQGDLAAVTEVPSTNSAVLTSDNRPVWDLSNLFIPRSAVTLKTKADLNPDSLIHPLKTETAALKRLEHGWIFGLNANTVDNNPLRLSILPHFGYFRSYRFRSNTVLQADLMLKYVSGYQLHIETVDITPGGTSRNVLNTNNLLYLELPLFVKRSFNPGQSWLLGIKPSGNVKILSTGSGSYFNDSSRRQYGSQAGVRYFDLGLVFGWEWRYHERWALDIRYNQGLLDLTHDQFYRDNSTHLNSDLQLSLRYSMVKKIRSHAPKTVFPAPAGQ